MLKPGDEFPYKARNGKDRIDVFTQLRKNFCDLWIDSQNATDAFRKAGYSLVNKKTGIPHSDAYVRSEALKTLKYPASQQYIEDRYAEMAKQAGYDAQATLSLLKSQANADPRELSEHVIGACRYCWGENNRYQRTQNEILIAREKFEKELNDWITEHPGKTYDKEFDIMGGIGFDPRKRPNPECCECWGYGKGRTIIKDTRDLSPEGLALYAGIKQTKDGIEVKTNSQDAARLNLIKHFGLITDRIEISDPLVKDLLAMAECLKRQGVSVEQVDKAYEEFMNSKGLVK